jgi:hypothetical protein
MKGGYWGLHFSWLAFIVALIHSWPLLIAASIFCCKPTYFPGWPTSSPEQCPSSVGYPVSFLEWSLSLLGRRSEVLPFDTVRSTV